MTETSQQETPYPSLAALRAVHNELLKSVRDTRNLNNVPLETDKLQAFLVRGVATGRLIESEDDRTTAQGLLDYWSALAYRTGLEIDDTTLAEFDYAADPELDEALCPYPGMRPYEIEEADKFYGRKRLVEWLLKRLQNTRILAMVGSVGSGKSSVLRAGLVPGLRAGGFEGSEDWRYLRTITPGTDPMSQLHSLVATPNVAASVLSPEALAEAIAAGSSMPVVLLVDQFEELFTLNDDEQLQQSFIDTLVYLANVKEPRHTILIGMRSDVENVIARFPGLYSWFELGRVQLLPPGAGELREAIEKPAELIGLKFEAGLVDKLIQDMLGEPAALPLLQFTLLELWERREKNRITWAAYQQTGAGRDAIARVAEATYTGLDVAEQRMAKRMLLRLINYDKGLTATTRRQRRALLLQGLEPYEVAEKALAKLIYERVVRFTPGAVPDEDQLELAHESMATNWPKMAEWLANERSALDIRRRLETRAAEWAQLGRSDAGLLDPVQLAEAESWMSSEDGKLIGFDELLGALVGASRGAIEEKQQHEVRQAQNLVEAERQRAEAERQRAEAERQRAEAQQRRAEIEAQRKRQIGSALLFIGVLAIVALALASFALQQASIARTQETAARIESNTRVAQAFELQTAEAAANQSAQDARNSLQQAESARATAEAARAEAEQQRQEAEQQRQEAEQQRLEARAGELSALAFATQAENPQFGLLLAAESVKISLDNGIEPAAVALATLQDSLLHITGKGYYKHSSIATNVAFDAAGNKLITAGLDGRIVIWDAKNLAIEPQIIEANYPIYRMLLSPNGRWLVASSESTPALRLWDLDNATAVDLDAGGGVNEIKMSADGQLLATVSQDGATRVWNIANLAAGPRLLRVSSPATALALSPDSRFVLTGHSDGLARLWNLASRDPISPNFTRDRRPEITVVEFSPNGRWLLISDNDGFTHLWSVGGGGFSSGPYVLRGQSGSITALAVTPGSDLALTGSDDGSIFVWSIAAGSDPPPRSVLRAHAGLVSSMAISPDGKQLASTGFSQSSYDNIVALWDLTARDPGKEGTALTGHSGGVSQAAYHPDGTSLATVSADGSLRIWDLTRPPPTLDELPKDPQALIALACQIAGRTIYPQEWIDNGFTGDPPTVCK
jgi:WD40 repeat protein